MSTTKTPERPLKLSAKAKRVEEAMRRATVEATTGPKELRSGRFAPQVKPRAAE